MKSILHNSLIYSGLHLKNKIRWIAFAGMLLLFNFTLQAQFLNADTALADPGSKVYTNNAAGEFTPGKGFLLVKNQFASLNISLYAQARWLNQLSSDSTYEDHLGNVKAFDGRNDIYFHRAMLWFTGFLYTPKLTYLATVWTVTTTQQTLVYGNINYKFNERISAGIGIVPNACIRSIQGPFPFYASTDRTMAEESIRGGFTNGIFLAGEILPRLRYNAVLGNNLSILGVKASNLTRHFSKSISLSWMPTTGEFGPRGGNGDFEHHEKLATRFGASYCHSRENRFNNTGNPSPDNTQVRMSDGGLFFETGALASGVTVIEADYDLTSIDIGIKYKGFALHTEFYYRTLSQINADGEVPIGRITDKGYTAQILYMAIPKKLCIYGINSMLIDEFKVNPWEAGIGINIYPSQTRSWRINLQGLHVYRSAAGGTFGLYTTGQTGTIITIGTDILL